VKSHDSSAPRSPGKNQRAVARAACRPGPSARMGRLWLQPHKEHIKAGHPANISFKPSPLRGLGHTGPQRAGRLNSGVRRRQTKIFSTWGSPTERHRNSRCQSATYSVQLESSCTPSVDQLSREKLAGAQNQFCAAGPGLTSLLWNSGPTQRQLAGQPPNNSSKPTPLRGVVIASRYQTNTPPQSGAS
jgi:hypothetical protein